MGCMGGDTTSCMGVDCEGVWSYVRTYMGVMGEAERSSLMLFIQIRYLGIEDG